MECFELLGPVVMPVVMPVVYGYLGLPFYHQRTDVAFGNVNEV